MRLKLSYLVLVLILVVLSDTKRSRGRSRGSSSSSSSTFWSRKTKTSESQKPAASPPKPSAPKEPEIKKQSANVQQSAAAPNSGRPIGWNVDNSSPNKKINQPSNNAPPPYSPHNAPPAYSPHNSPGYSHNVPPPAYHQNAPPAYNNLYPNGHANTGLYNNPHGVGGYPGHGGYPNTGMHPNPGAYPGYGGMPHNPAGYPGQNNFGHYNSQPGYYPNQMGGGYGGYPQQQTGMMGSMFGGRNHGYGGYGGYGGFGGYGMKKSGGFFGKHAFRNVLGGLFVWYLVSGLVSKPYKVYNYYNQPREQREEITLPANVLTLCNENATNICVPGTIAICTQDNKILCVTTMTATTPCQNNTGEMCVNTTIPCLDSNDPLCQNKTNVDNTTVVNLPCFTNMTLDTSQMPTASNVTLPESENNKFCVTTMAEPDPDAPPVNLAEATSTPTSLLTSTSADDTSTIANDSSTSTADVMKDNNNSGQWSGTNWFLYNRYASRY